MKLPRSARLLIAACIVLGGAIGFAATRGCLRSQRLVEVFDNGPVGGPSGPSEGYIWVGQDDHPPPGKSWKPTDPATLTPQQKTRIH